MITQFHISHTKFWQEHSNEVVVAVDISTCAIRLFFYDSRLERAIGRSALVAEPVTADTVVRQLSRLLSMGMKEHSVSASAITKVGVAAPVHISCFLEEALSATDLYLRPDTELKILPFVSANFSGRMLAAVLSRPKGCRYFVWVDNALALFYVDKKAVCACVQLSGAFDGTSVESGMPCEEGAIDNVSREKDGTICYSVVNDVDSLGISPSGVVTAISLMASRGVVDEDGIMTDRDLFYIGEDYYISQSDVRAVQMDKARCAAGIELFEKKSEINTMAALGGEVFALNGVSAMTSIGAIPERMSYVHAEPRAVEWGTVAYLTDEAVQLEAERFCEQTNDISEEILADFDDLYIKNLSF